MGRGISHTKGLTEHYQNQKKVISISVSPEYIDYVKRILTRLPGQPTLSEFIVNLLIEEFDCPATKDMEEACIAHIVDKRFKEHVDSLTNLHQQKVQQLFANRPILEALQNDAQNQRPAISTLPHNNQPQRTPLHEPQAKALHEPQAKANPILQSHAPTTAQNAKKAKPIFQPQSYFADTGMEIDVLIVTTKEEIQFSLVYFTGWPDKTNYEARSTVNIPAKILAGYMHENDATAIGKSLCFNNDTNTFHDWLPEDAPAMLAEFVDTVCKDYWKELGH